MIAAEPGSRMRETGGPPDSNLQYDWNSSDFSAARPRGSGVSDFSVSDFRKHKSVPIGQEISIVCQGENQKKHGQIPKRNMLSPVLDAQQLNVRVCVSRASLAPFSGELN